MIVIPDFIRNPEGRLNGWRDTCLALLLAVPVLNADSVFYMILPAFLVVCIVKLFISEFFLKNIDGYLGKMLYICTLK